MKYFLLLIVISFPALAIDNPHFMRSPRGLLMGDAFTAVNDDSFSLFYNPASLGRKGAGDLTMTPVNAIFSGTNVLGDLDKFKDFPDDPAGVSDVLLDYPVHASAGTAPGLRLFNVGVTFIANQSLDAVLRNRSHPMLDVDLRNDRGVVAGVGFPIGSNRIGKSGLGMQTNFGISAKMIERTGLLDSMALTGPTVLNALGKDDPQALMKALGSVKGRGYGVDAGLEHIIKTGPSKLVFGLAALDITGTDFSINKKDNPDDLKLARIRDQVNLGAAWGVDLSLVDFIVSADVRGLNEQMDFGKRLRLGAQLGLPGIKLMAGSNSGYYSYGATIDLIIAKLTGGFYDVEIGTQYKQLKSKQFILYLSLFDFSFDA